MKDTAPFTLHCLGLLALEEVSHVVRILKPSCGDMHMEEDLRPLTNKQHKSDTI